MAGLFLARIAVTLAETRIQLCGRLVARVAGRRIEDELPGRQGRLAFVYLVAHRQRPVSRDELVEAVWAQQPAGDALSPLLSKLRRVLPLTGRGEVRIELDADAWIEERRQAVEELHLHALELVSRACLEIGGGELDTAERSARTLVRLAPYRESGHRLLMQAPAARGNEAEALLVYDGLRRQLRDDLGTNPSVATRDLHQRLLG